MTAMVTAAGTRAALYEQLHERFEPGAYDNWVVWAGNLGVEVDGLYSNAALARAYVGDGGATPMARVRVELYVADVPVDEVRAGDIDARAWTDANAREEGSGRHLPMRLRCGDDGRPLPAGNNLVLESESFRLERTGVFSYTVELSADRFAAGVEQKSWVPISAMADNRDGVIVVSPAWVQARPSVMEVCARKAGARLTGRSFRSGRLSWVTDHLEEMPVDVVYLLPFYKPGCGDVHTGKDVRKGTLGSVYAVADFFQVDPDLVTPPDEVDLPALVAAGLLTDGDVADVLARMPGESGRRRQAASPRDSMVGAADGDKGDRTRRTSAADRSSVPAGETTVSELARLGAIEAARRWGRERLVQLVARAELRALTRRAHELDKRVIFDLVLMQTSRDSHLISKHPTWYLRDEKGRPRIHQIAWLVYSDVALFDLVHNEPLQAYLLEVAPYWIETCDLDGVRIDASQTVDRPFLKRIKNSINAVKEDALVLGETLCPLAEAVDVPVDMVYALMVDFHRDADRAGPLIEFLEQVHGQYAAGTVAMAYFENHDSPRATQIWHDRFSDALPRDPDASQIWKGVSLLPQPDRHGPGGLDAPPAEAGDPASGVTGGVQTSTQRQTDRAVTREALVDWPEVMALLKNLQATVIDCTAGMGPTAGGAGDDGEDLHAAGTQLTYALEFGSEWGEETRTDFENASLLHHGWRQREPQERLVRAYEEFPSRLGEWSQLDSGQVYYHRNEMEGGDGDDAVLGYVRHDAEGALLVLHNLDYRRARQVTYRFDYLNRRAESPRLVYDSYAALGLGVPGAGEGALPTEAASSTGGGTAASAADGMCFIVHPLQSKIYRLC